MPDAPELIARRRRTRRQRREAALWLGAQLREVFAELEERLLDVDPSIVAGIIAGQLDEALDWQSAPPSARQALEVLDGPVLAQVIEVTIVTAQALASRRGASEGAA